MRDGERPAGGVDDVQPQRYKDRFYAWRDALLANSRFQKWAATFPLTRPIAQRHARRAFELCAGFVYSQVLMACVELDIFTRVAERARTVAELAPELGLSLQATERLLLAAEAIGLLESRSGARFGLGVLGAAIVGNPGISAMVRHHKVLYSDLADPVGLLRKERGTTDLSRFWAYSRGFSPAQLGSDAVATYSALMSGSLDLVSSDILDSYDFTQHRHLLDVGGGEGHFIAAVAARAPNLSLSLFDLPAVADRAIEQLRARGLATRVRAVGGDFCRDRLPDGADLVVLVRIVHDHDDDVVVDLLKRIFEALPPGGTLLIAEPMAGASGGERAVAAYFNIYLMAMGSGRPRTPQELAKLLEEAGFSDVRPQWSRRPILTRVLLARRPN